MASLRAAGCNAIVPRISQCTRHNKSPHPVIVIGRYVQGGTLKHQISLACKAA